MQSLVKLYQIKAKPPSLADNTGDLDRLKKALTVILEGQNPVVPFSRISPVAEAFRQSGFKGFAVVVHNPTGPQIVDFYANAPEFLVGMALDLGTTHLEASLVDLLTGKVMDCAAEENGQLEFGADILARIHFAPTKVGDRSGLDLLHERVIESIHKLAVELVGRIKLKNKRYSSLICFRKYNHGAFFPETEPLSSLSRTLYSGSQCTGPAPGCRAEA